jgi:hypothetical protein
MPPATRLRRGQAEHHGRLHYDHAPTRTAADALSISRELIAQQRSNAAHHAPPRTSAIDNNSRVGGRVHALVMRRPTPAETRARRYHVVATWPLVRDLPSGDTAA